MRLFPGRFFSPQTASHMVAGWVAVLVGYTSSAALVFQAAHAAGATPGQLTSWLLALGVGMGVTCIGLSLAYRVPVLTAWSTPGAALLAGSLSGVSMNEAVGAFMLASLLMVLVGVSGGFDRLLRWLPRPLAAAMLAGVLLRFGSGAFASLSTAPLLVGGMLLAYLGGRRWLPRFAVPLTLLVGLLLAGVEGRLQTAAIVWSWAQPEWMAPAFSAPVLLGVGVPLFVVTLASQNVPGLAVLRANGYGEPQAPASALVSWTGLTGVVLSPFGGFSYNLAAITAAICMTPDADPDPRQRYRAAVWAGVFYLCTGLMGATVASVLAAVPAELVLAIAGLALLGTIASSLADALSDARERESALITFLVTVSGVTLLGVGSAFWGVVLGWMARQVLLRRKGA